MKKIALILVIALILGSAALNFGLSSILPSGSDPTVLDSNDMQAIYEYLNLLYVDSECIGINKQEFTDISIGELLPMYSFSNEEISSSSIFMYPLFFGDNLEFFFVKSILEDGTVHRQLTQELICEIVPYYLNGQQIAIIYNDDVGESFVITETNDINILNSSLESNFSMTETEMMEMFDEGLLEFGDFLHRETIEYTPPVAVTLATGSASVGISFVSQTGVTNGCWAACVASVGNKLKSQSYTCADVMEMIHGDANAGEDATLYEMLRALTSIYSVTYPYYSYLSPPSSALMYNNLSQGYPVFSFWETPSLTLGHFTVIKSINTSDTIGIMNPSYGMATIALNSDGKYTYVSTNNQKTYECTGYGSKYLAASNNSIDDEVII